MLFRSDIVKTRHVRLLTNIGGNHAMLGNCAHASSWPNGLHRSVATCAHADRGAIARIHELGIPVIHFLNIKELGLKNGISDSYTSNEELFVTRRTNTIAALCSLALLASCVLLL